MTLQIITTNQIIQIDSNQLRYIKKVTQPTPEQTYHVCTIDNDYIMPANTSFHFGTAPYAPFQRIVVCITGEL